ncbi:hypothetical protein KEM48_001177 [Puccinia striiformis f. sp. tritici PST-130]|nr:hypothetical protein KEM48_001177 [Puccinia striiformis f. sp. tritici PST-130]
MRIFDETEAIKILMIMHDANELIDFQNLISIFTGSYHGLEFDDSLSGDEYLKAKSKAKKWICVYDRVKLNI